VPTPPTRAPIKARTGVHAGIHRPHHTPIITMAAPVPITATIPSLKQRLVESDAAIATAQALIDAGGSMQIQMDAYARI